jgi:hypothetical protein
MINTNLLNTLNQYFAIHRVQSFVVNPSIPILYFGDEVGYRNSYLKVITVGKNPSLNEFLDPNTNHYNINYRFPNWNGVNLTQVLDEYFRQIPLKQWFSSFEPILNGKGCSYYTNNGFDNIALHTDICSPLATDPTWSRLNVNQQQLLFTQGVQIWWDLIKALAPDIILVSIPQNLFLNNISNVLGQPIFTITHRVNGIIRQWPYIVYRQQLNINNRLTKIVFGQAANKPFGTISNAKKLILGGLI